MTDLIYFIDSTFSYTLESAKETGQFYSHAECCTGYSKSVSFSVCHSSVSCQNNSSYDHAVSLDDS